MFSGGGVQPCEAQRLPGSEPDPQQVMRNKRACSYRPLGPYGVNNDRHGYSVGSLPLRAQPRRHVADDAGEGVCDRVRDGVVTGVTFTDGGSGYSSPPAVSISGMPNVKVTATLSFDADFKKNGAVKELTVLK